MQIWHHKQQHALPDARLQHAIRICSTWQQCDAVLDAHEQQLDAMLISCLVTQAVRVAGTATAPATTADPVQAKQPSGGAAKRRAEQKALHSFLGRLSALALARSRSFRPQQFSNVLWGLAKLGHRPGSEWMEQYLAAAEVLLVRFHAGNLAQLAWALGAMRYTPQGSFLGGLLAESGEKVGSFEARDVANFAWALTVLQVTPPPELLANLAGRAVDLLQPLEQSSSQPWQVKAEELSISAWALAKLGWQAAAWEAEAFVAAALVMGPKLSAQQVANTLWALAAWQARLPPRLLAELADLATQRLRGSSRSAGSAQAIVTVLCALGRLGQRPGAQQSGAMLQLAAAQLPVMSQRELAEVLLAVARLRVRPGGDWMEQHMALSADGMALARCTDMAQMLSSYRVLCWRPAAQWWSSFWYYSPSVLATATPAELAMLLRGLAVLSSRRPNTEWKAAYWARLWELMDERCQSTGRSVRGDSSNSSSSSSSSAMHVMQIRHQLMHDTAQHTPLIQPCHLATILWSCAKLALLVPAAVAYRILGLAVQFKADFTTPQLAATLWALAKLRPLLPQLPSASLQELTGAAAERAAREPGALARLLPATRYLRHCRRSTVHLQVDGKHGRMPQPDSLPLHV